MRKKINSGLVGKFYIQESFPLVYRECFNCCSKFRFEKMWHITDYPFVFNTGFFYEDGFKKHFVCKRCAPSWGAADNIFKKCDHVPDEYKEKALETMERRRKTEGLHV